MYIYCSSLWRRFKPIHTIVILRFQFLQFQFIWWISTFAITSFSNWFALNSLSMEKLHFPIAKFYSPFYFSYQTRSMNFLQISAAANWENQNQWSQLRLAVWIEQWLDQSFPNLISHTFVSTQRANPRSTISLLIMIIYRTKMNRAYHSVDKQWVCKRLKRPLGHLFSQLARQRESQTVNQSVTKLVSLPDLQPAFQSVSQLFRIDHWKVRWSATFRISFWRQMIEAWLALTVGLEVSKSIRWRQSTPVSANHASRNSDLSVRLRYSDRPTQK